MTTPFNKPQRKPRKPIGSGRGTRGGAIRWALPAAAVAVLVFAVAPDAALAGDQKKHKGDQQHHAVHQQLHQQVHRQVGQQVGQHGFRQITIETQRGHDGHRFHERRHQRYGQGDPQQRHGYHTQQPWASQWHNRGRADQHLRQQCTCITRVWVPPVYRTSYDSCGRRYRLLAQPGYYKTVRQHHGCTLHDARSRRHHESGIRIQIGARF